MKYFITILFIQIFCLTSLLAQGNPWTPKTDMPTGRFALSASAVNGKIYVMGGAVSGTILGGPASPIVEVYDPLTDSWDTTKAPMQTARNSFTSEAVGGKIYVFGGQSQVGYINTATVEEYDPSTNTWTYKDSMPDVRAGLSSCVVNDKIYIIGGWKFTGPNSFHHYREVWEYDPANDSWDTTKAPMPTGREYLTTSVANENIFAFGGWDESTAFATVEMYNPATDEWSILDNLPEERVYVHSATVNNLIYIFGGSTLHNVPPKTDTWEYKSVFDSYRTVASMPMGMMHGAASEVNGKIYAFGGTSLPMYFPMQSSAKVFEFTPPIINVPADQPTIQAAIDSSVDGDMVLVADSTYYENINFKGKKITVASQYVMDGDTNHINNTVIDGSQPSHPDSGSVVYFVSDEDTNSVLSGFTITGGTGTRGRLFPGWWPGISGGGILILGSGAKIEKNKIIQNNITATTPSDSGTNGTAIVAFGDVGDYLVIRDNLISENTATSDWVTFGAVNWGTRETCVFERNEVSANVANGDYTYGGGLILFGQQGWDGDYIVRNNIIRNNILNATFGSTGGGLYIQNCSPEVTNNIISSNSSRGGGGVNVEHVTQQTGIPNPEFYNNTITNNSSTTYGGGLRVGGSPLAVATVMNTVLWGNSAGIAGPQIYISVSGGAANVVYSDVQDTLWPGTGNINADPLLVADSLTDASPCIGAGTLPCPPYDINGRLRPYPAGSDPDMGAWESKLGTLVGIEVQPSAGILRSFALEQNYPNPFNPITTIEFDLPKTTQVTLKIFNILGEEVTTLVSDKLSTGSYSYDWDASSLASGVYLYRLEAEGFVQTRKMILMK